MPDWIEDFVSATEPIWSPTVFRRWAAIGALAGALERRVYTVTDAPLPLRSNLYIVLTGLPASGKGLAIGLARQVLADVKGISFGPDNPSPASFLDRLASTTQMSNGAGIQSAMVTLCRELGNLIPKYDEQFAAALTDMWDNISMFDAPRRQSKSVAIENPTLNILAGSTPATLGRLPESVWDEGLTSRIIFIFSESPSGIRDMFQKKEKLDLVDLGKRLNTIFADVYGEMIWTDEAREAQNDWFNIKKQEPVPRYGKLVHYNGRRNEQICKLAMISSVSWGNFPYVQIEDWTRAQEWLFQAETRMPDVFRSISVKSDLELAKDCHYYLYVQFSKLDRNLRKALPESTLYKFLENKTTSDRIDGVIKMMEKTARIRRTPLGEIIPNPYDNHMDIE